MATATLIAIALVVLFSIAAAMSLGVIGVSVRKAWIAYGQIRAELSALSDVREASFRHVDTVVLRRPALTITWKAAHNSSGFLQARPLPLAA